MTSGRLPKSQWSTASRDYAQAHLHAQREIQRIATGGPMPLDAAFQHHHEQPTFDNNGEIVTLGNEACTACLSPTEQQTVRSEIEKLLAACPTPAPVARDCHCDGSGMVDTPEALETLLSLDTGPRAVFPCPQCRPEVHQRYQDGEYDPIRT